MMVIQHQKQQKKHAANPSRLATVAGVGVIDSSDGDTQTGTEAVRQLHGCWHGQESCDQMTN